MLKYNIIWIINKHFDTRRHIYQYAKNDHMQEHGYKSKFNINLWTMKDEVMNHGALLCT
jgi:hypothetical protein